MAIPKYAAHVPKEKLAYYECRGRCNGATHGAVSAPSWSNGGQGLMVTCLKCGHVQTDSYKWAHVK